MFESTHRTAGHLLAACLGVFVGGALVLAVGKVLPKMMSQMMSGMMHSMIEQMGDEGCNPADI